MLNKRSIDLPRKRLVVPLSVSTEERRRADNPSPLILQAAAAASESAAAAPADGVSAPVAAPADAMDEEDEDALLQAALAISMQGLQPPAATTPVVTPAVVSDAS